MNLEEIGEDEATVEISNDKYPSQKFRTKEEALIFIHKHCPNLWTRLKRKTEKGWVVAGSIIPEGGRPNLSKQQVMQNFNNERRENV